MSFGLQDKFPELVSELSQLLELNGEDDDPI